MWILVTFSSILFEHETEASQATTPAQPLCFSDLHLDQIVARVCAGRDEYDLAPFFYRSLHTVDAVHYRHQILGDLRRDEVLDPIGEFGRRMKRMRGHLAMVEKGYYAREKQRWFLSAVAEYCKAVEVLAEQLAGLRLPSRGLVALRVYLDSYRESDHFVSLRTQTQQRSDELAGVTYAVQINGSRVKVRPYEAEPDVSEEVERNFAKFRRGEVKSYLGGFGDFPQLNHVEAQILDLVARLYPDVFARLEAYCERHRGYLDRTLARFDREVQFYLAYFDYIGPLRRAGLAFSDPVVSTESKNVGAAETFDLALASQLVEVHERVVANDFYLSDPERIVVVSGPNNGGKTTFARTFGQLHYLAGLGLPVPGRDVRLFLPDQVFTHFEREESIETLRGKFEDELYRIREILELATPDSVLIMNESFGSTTVRDALLVGSEVIREIIELDALCVFVTFVDELASLGETTVSMMSTVVPDDPAVRTYKVVRKPADGLAYAAALADKYGLRLETLRGRVAR
jgi:DNA mismatch repair protein MutS